MITEVKEKRVTDQWAVNFEFDGHWVVLHTDPADGKDYVIAYGDGTPEDRDALRENFVWNRYRGDALLTYAHTPREEVINGMYEC